MDRYDVFISHAHADKDWVHVLAENRRNAGLEVFLDGQPFTGRRTGYVQERAAHGVSRQLAGTAADESSARSCRYLVPWAEDGGQAVDWHLGPLSLAETRKLIWRLPGLDALELEEQQRAYADVGRHPRALEYLDALLRGGEARFRDVAQRMQHVVHRQRSGEPEELMKEIT